MTETLSRLWQQVLIEAGVIPPWQLFLAIAILPLVGVPVSPLLIAAGIRAGPLNGALLAIAGLTINIALGHCVARGWPRKALTAWLLRRGYRLPQAGPIDETRLILMTRLIPGLPLAVQNYLLGLAGVRFWPYLLYSVPIHAVYAIGFVLLGGSLVNSTTWRFATAGAVLIGASLGLSLISRRLQHRAATSEASRAATPLPP